MTAQTCQAVLNYAGGKDSNLTVSGTPSVLPNPCRGDDLYNRLCLHHARASLSNTNVSGRSTLHDI